MKFKIGDKVKCVRASRFAGLTDGQIYTVSGKCRIGPDAAVRLKEFPKYEIGFFVTRFVLADASFNVSTATDQELADEYRTVRTKLKELNDELVLRGYSVVSKGDVTKISKVLTTEL